MDLSFYRLLDLQRFLRYVKYDELNLKNLDPLRWEVDREIEKKTGAKGDADEG